VRVAVLFFAVLREAAGTTRIEIDLPEGATLDDLRAVLTRERPTLAAALARYPALVEGRVSHDGAALHDGDEVAWIPPVAGGSGGVVQVGLTREPIDVERLRRAVEDPGAGAVVLFVGTVRDHEGERAVEALEYEAYERVATERLGALADEALGRWPGARIAVVHRLGRLTLGEASVAVAVATAHRAEAFDCCRHLMERLKHSVPIWKRSFGPQGAVWVEGKGYEE
jgi:molybdopterin synthase catalytic subunit/molybdopterin converting factor small subunit